MNAVASRHQRAQGAARIAFKLAGGRTRLADLYQRAPCRVLFPQAEDGEPLQAVLLTTSGGLTGGDCTNVEIEVGLRASATVTTQAAEKLYRALPGDADTRVGVRMSVGEWAWGEWLAQETILFDGARLRRRFEADVAAHGRLLAVESIVFGRTAMGERYEQGFLQDSWRIRFGGRLVWADGLQLHGDLRQARAAPFGFGTAVACATIVYVGQDARQQLEAVRTALACLAPCSGSSSQGATAFDGMLLVRLLADDAADLRSQVMRIVAGLRRTAGGLRAHLPRGWHC